MLTPKYWYEYTCSIDELAYLKSAFECFLSFAEYHDLSFIQIYFQLPSDTVMF